MLGARGLPGPQQPDLKRHARTRICSWTNLPRNRLRAYVKGPVVVDFAQLRAKSPLHLLSALRHSRMPSLASLASTGQWWSLLACRIVVHFCGLFVASHGTTCHGPHPCILRVQLPGVTRQPASPDSSAWPRERLRMLQASGVGHPTSTRTPRHHRRSRLNLDEPRVEARWPWPPSIPPHHHRRSTHALPRQPATVVLRWSTAVQPLKSAFGAGLRPSLISTASVGS